MHEYSLVSALVDQVEGQARPYPGARVRRVHLVIGELAGVDPELLATAFETFRAHTVCAEAELAIDRRAACWSCPSCGTVLTPGAELRCAPCATPARLTAGDEITLQRIELEMADD